MNFYHAAAEIVCHNGGDRMSQMGIPVIKVSSKIATKAYEGDAYDGVIVRGAAE